ncbi:hypothetical protein FR943_05380 [Mycobacterium sp. TNTM28]|uniref:Outer membrane channel protein CpnT-like N-terminal domain-containing protein n=1 Tax=[Mycobacterium] fortunisiensis TaxID=2600579 RepID=A0ABS6KI80_9MYCO|nr:hypothetical protein [[Mycobacterium] fortunisiensis]MBU9763274.1 hypothetical protein [[Mycobacterium] fortunisiensis]
MVDVDPQVFFAASASTRISAQQLSVALSNLTSGLSGSGGMAGSDNTGQKFSEDYDQSANDIATVLAGLGDISHNRADLIKATGDNHAAANRASTDGSSQPVNAIAVPERSFTQPPSIPSAYGGGGSEPTGAIATAWHYIQKWVGYVWPNGSPEKLEAAAETWTAAGNAIRIGLGPLDQAKEGLSGQVSPEIPAATQDLADLRGKVDDLSWACLNAATSCNDLAQAIKDAHQELIDELSQFAAEFVVGEVIFAVFFEVGGEIWGNAAMAARAAVIAERCARIIEKLFDLAKAAGRIAKAAAEAIAKVLADMKSVVQAVVSKTPGVDREAARLSDVANRFHSALDPIAADMRTTSALSTREGTDIIAGGKRDLTPAQRAQIQDGEQLAKNPNLHAELTALEKAQALGLHPRQIVASRPLCPDCQRAIVESGGTILPDGLGAVWP